MCMPGQTSPILPNSRGISSAEAPFFFFFFHIAVRHLTLGVKET